MISTNKKLGLWSATLTLALSTLLLPTRSDAQDDYQPQDDPPTRVARLGYMEGSVSFDPAGEDAWVGAVENRPMTTGDKLWSDKGSRAELQLGSAVIRLSENTGVSFLNLDDHTAQLQLSSGAINIRVRRLDRDDDFEIDTPNLAFTINQPGSYRIEASEDGTYSVVTLHEGDGEATGNGQTYRIHAGQRATFTGTQSLDADVEQIGDPDQFDNWAASRDHRHDDSRTAQYVSSDMVGYDDLDDNGDWRDDSSYGHVWFPHVEAGWAPYHTGHWDWIDPWGYTWVDDSPWGYAPFHYGRWASVGGRWGWIAGPREERAVYAPALVVFVGGGGGGDIGWFPLGPREVYVPTYPVSREYVNRINVSNTTVNTTTITNVYNTTVINKTTTNVTNITYANRNVQGAMTAVPQRAFASAQPVAKASVGVNTQQLASAPVMHRVAVAPTREAVLGAKASSAGHVTAPPAAVMSRQVIAKKTPPPPPVPFAKQQQAMAAHPGQPLPKKELASLRPAAAAHPAVKVAPAGKPATPTTGHPPANVPRPAGAPAGQPANNRPGAPANQPANRPGQPAANEHPGQPANRPGQPAANEHPGQPANRPGQPAANEHPGQPENRPGQPAANEHPGQPANRPGQPAANEHPGQPANRPGQPNTPAANQPGNRPAAGQPNRPPAEMNRPTEAPAHPTAQPNNRPAESKRPPSEANHPPATQPSNRPETNRPAEAPAHPAAQPNNRPAEPNRPAETNRPPASQPANHPPAESNRPAAQPARPPAESKPAPENRPAARPAQPAPQQHPPAAQENRPPAAKPAPPPKKEPAKTPEEKKREEKPNGM